VLRDPQELRDTIRVIAGQCERVGNGVGCWHTGRIRQRSGMR
jgi:hypothetical protein